MDATIALAIQGVREDVASSLQVMQSALDTRSAPVRERTPALAVQIADPQPLAPVAPQIADPQSPAPTHDLDRVEL
eukprot:6182489-Pyramimonas_sp.AAC.1